MRPLAKRACLVQPVALLYQVHACFDQILTLATATNEPTAKPVVITPANHAISNVSAEHGARMGRYLAVIPTSGEVTPVPRR
jgi:hypothetical protein